MQLRFCVINWLWSLFLMLLVQSEFSVILSCDLIIVTPSLNVVSTSLFFLMFYYVLLILYWSNIDFLCLEFTLKMSESQHTVYGKFFWKLAKKTTTPKACKAWITVHFHYHAVTDWLSDRYMADISTFDVAVFEHRRKTIRKQQKTWPLA